MTGTSQIRPFSDLRKGWFFKLLSSDYKPEVIFLYWDDKPNLKDQARRYNVVDTDTGIFETIAPNTHYIVTGIWTEFACTNQLNLLLF